MFPARCPVWASLGQPREESSKNRWENPGWAERRGYLLQAHFLLDSRHKQSVSLTLEIFSPVLKYFPQQDWWTSWWTSRRTTPAFRAELGGKLIFWQLYQPGYIERYEWLGCPTCESPMSLNSISVKSSPAGTIWLDLCIGSRGGSSGKFTWVCPDIFFIFSFQTKSAYWSHFIVHELSHLPPQVPHDVLHNVPGNLGDPTMMLSMLISFVLMCHTS